MSFFSSGADHPDHYGGKDNPHEVIKVLEHWLTPEEYIGFCKGNAIKYQARHREKGGLLDLEKAAWYQVELVRFCKSKNMDPRAYVLVDQEEHEKMMAELERLKLPTNGRALPKATAHDEPEDELLSADDLAKLS